MKSTFKALLALIISLLLLVSCSIPGFNQGSGGGQTDDNGSSDNDKPSGGDNSSDGDTSDGDGDTPDGDNPSDGGLSAWERNDCIYYRGDTDVSASTLNARFLRDTFVSFSGTGGPDDGKLFIVGEYDSTLSRYAYSRMERAFSEADGSTIFTIATNGTSVAIAYESFIARYAAIDYFFNEFYNLDLTKSGVVVTKEFNVKSYITDMRTELREEDFKALEDSLSAGAINELTTLFSLYDEQVYIWLANLWDPDIGAFYYSASGRDTHGFLPDLESTAQALMFMSESGMLEEYDGKYREALPAEMKSAILNFAKECQDSTDGYFYHPQWGKAISATRLGRDLGWATRIISGLGAKPYWNTPNGVKGEYGAPGITPAVALTEHLGVDKVSAVSRLIFTSAPAYLTDVSLFVKHLEEDFDWENNSYRAGNAIESELGQIQNAGTAYTEALIEFLNGKQKSNGLWENEVSYDSVNGLMKISGVYTSLKKVIPNADKAMESAITMLKSTEKAAHVCSVYNPWEAVANILVSIETVSGKSEADALRAQFRAEAQSLIKITFEKLAIFKKSDGGFSYYIKYSAANSQGSAVALEKSVESDVNATMICTNSIIGAMFDVFGVQETKRYYPLDFAYFSDVLYDLGTIVKDDILPAEEIGFDEYESGWGEEEGGVVKYPADLAENTVGDTDKLTDGNYKWFQSSVVKNPTTGASKTDRVLHVKSNVYVGEEKALANKPSSTRFTIPNAGLVSLGDCYVYDADMYFVPGYGKTNYNGKATSDPIMQLFFMTESLPCASVNFSVYTENGVDYVKIGENFAGIDGKESNVAGGIPMGEWVNIRLEFYKKYETNDKDEQVYKPMLKVYIDGEFRGDCDANIAETNAEGQVVYYDRKIDRVSISYYRYLACEMYLDNVLVERCRKQYVEGENPDAIVDPPIPDEEMRESYGFEDGLLNTSNVVNKVRVVDFGVSKYINAASGQTYNPYISYSIEADPDNAANHVLKVLTLKSTKFDKPSRTEVNLYNSGASGTAYTFSGKFYYSSEDIGINGDLTQLFILNSLDGEAYSLRISAKKTNGVFKLSLIENNGGSGGTGSGKVICDGIACDEWFTLKVVFHKTGVAETTGADIYLNDELVLNDMSYKAGAITQNPIIKTAIVHQRTNKSVLYLDDLSFARSGETVDAVESDEKVASFTDGFNSKYVHSYTYDGSTKLDVPDIDSLTMEKLYTKFYLVYDPDVAANKVLRAVNKNGGTNAGYTKVDISNDNPKGDCYTFETKMYIETASATYSISQIKFIDKNGAAALNVIASIGSDGNLKIATTGSGSYPTAGTNLLEGSGLAVKKAEWFTLRIELYHKGASASASNTYAKLYINNILVYDGIAYSSLGSEISHVEIVHCKTKKSSAVYFDDIYLTKTDKQYAKNS